MTGESHLASSKRLSHLPRIQTDDSVARIVREEAETGFLEELGRSAAASSSFSPVSADEVDDQESTSFSHALRKELNLTIRLRRMIAGKPEVEDVQSGGARQCTEVSEETKKMQRLRRRRNCEAAKASRDKKRAMDKALRERLQNLEEDLRQLRDKAAKFEGLYRQSLSYMPTQSDFQSYLKRNPHLVRDPIVKPVLKAFVAKDYPNMPQYVMMALVPAEIAASKA